MNRFILPMITDKQRLPCFVYCVGGLENQVPIHREDGYNHYIWMHTVKGKGKLFLDGAEHTLKENSGVIIYPHVPHRYYATEEPWETRWVAFRGFAVHSLLELTGMARSEVYTVANPLLLDRHIQDIYASAAGNGPDGCMKCSGKLYAFLIDLPHCIVSEQSQSSMASYARLQQVLDYMERHYAEDLPLERIAAAVDVSPQYLCRSFQKWMSMTPVAYLTRLRLQKAKELLLVRELSVVDVGCKVGLRNASYFSYVFKQHEGISPTQFRNSFQ